MNQGGRPRKPRAQKIIRGTFRKGRNPEHEIEAPVVNEPPKPPASLNRWGKQVWRRLIPLLLAQRVLTEHDLETFELACAQYGLYRELYAEICCMIEDPETGRRRRRTVAEYLRGRNSQTQPELTAMQKAVKEWKAYMTEFGLSPLARNRIEHKPVKEEQDPMEEILNAK